jgi:hypothetical protein
VLPFHWQAIFLCLYLHTQASSGLFCILLHSSPYHISAVVQGCFFCAHTAERLLFLAIYHHDSVTFLFWSRLSVYLRIFNPFLHTRRYPFTSNFSRLAGPTETTMGSSTHCYRHRLLLPHLSSHQCYDDTVFHTSLALLFRLPLVVCKESCIHSSQSIFITISAISSCHYGFQWLHQGLRKPDCVHLCLVPPLSSSWILTYNLLIICTFTLTYSLLKDSWYHDFCNILFTYFCDHRFGGEPMARRQAIGWAVAVFGVSHWLPFRAFVQDSWQSYYSTAISFAQTTLLLSPFLPSHCGVSARN